MRGWVFLSLPLSRIILLLNVLQEIFRDHYEEIEYTLHPRAVEMENINNMIHCGDPA